MTDTEFVLHTWGKQYRLALRDELASVDLLPRRLRGAAGDRYEGLLSFTENSVGLSPYVPDGLVAVLEDYTVFEVRKKVAE